MRHILPGAGLGLIGLKLLLLLAMLAAVVLTLRLTPLAPSTRDLLIGLVVISTVPQANHVRPQLFSLVLFAWLLAVLVRTRHSKFALLLPIPMMVLWANVHGAWIVGAGTLCMWADGGLVSHSTTKHKLTVVAVAMAAVAATIFNPYGWRLWDFLRETVGFSRPDITEWQPVLRLGFVYVALWGLVFIALVIAVWRAVVNRSLDLQVLAMPLILSIASFRVSRLQAFFAISVVMLMGSQLCSVRQSAATQHHFAVKAARWPRLAMVFVVALAIITTSVGAASQNMGCVRMEPDQAPEASVTEVIDEHGLRGRMLTWFNWGEYAIWHWGTRGILVSMDGRRETVYSNAAVADHLKFYFQPDERHAIIQKLQPDFIWLPSHLKVIEGLQEDGWRAIHSGDRSVLLTKGEVPAREPNVFAHPAMRCFPGP